MKTGQIKNFERVPVVYPDPTVPVVTYSGQLGQAGKFHVHTEEDWELCYVASGEAQYRVGESEFRLGPGEILVIGPEDPHACIGWRGERIITIFRRSLLSETRVTVRCGKAIGLEVAGIRIPPRTSIVSWRRTSIEFLLDRLRQESFGGERAKKSMCGALLAQLFLELARSQGEQVAAAPVPVDADAKKIVDRMRTAVCAELDYPWTLAEMVKRSGYSSTQLSVFFRRATGQSPCQWLAQERIHRACELLAKSDQTTIQIASDVGFGTRSQFHRVFRKLTGTTPERYRSALQHEGQA